MLALTPAIAGAATSEPVIGGTTKLSLELPKSVKAKPIAPATADGATFTFPNVGGSLVPATGVGTLQVAGGIKFKAMRGRGKRGKVSFQVTKAGYGPTGSIRGTVGSKVVDLATVSGGAATTQATGVSVDGGSAVLDSDGAKVLNRKLAKKKKSKTQGKKRAAASGKKGRKLFKPGSRLGSLSTTAQFATVEVLAQGNVELVADLGTALKFNSKGVALADGVTPIDPATSPFPAEFRFPVTGGRLLPDVSGGQIESAGGLLIRKTAAVSGGCDAASPVGTFLRQTDLIVDLTLRALRATVNAASGLVGAGLVSAELDLSGATATVNPATGAFSISNVNVTLTAITASTLNSVFGSAAQGCGTDFVGGDPLGTISVSGQLRP